MNDFRLLQTGQGDPPAPLLYLMPDVRNAIDRLESESHAVLKWEVRNLGASAHAIDHIAPDRDEQPYRRK